MKYEDVKIDDEFIMRSNRGKSLVKVTKVTPTRFEVGHVTFLKKDGSEYGGSRYYGNWIEKATDELKKQFFNEQRIQKETRECMDKINKLNFRELDLGKLKRITSIIEEE